MHPEFNNVFANLQMLYYDWDDGHPRFLYRESVLEINFTVPFAEIRDHYPNASFRLDSVLFTGDMNIEELAFIDILVNNVVVLYNKSVPTKKLGLTML